MSIEFNKRHVGEFNPIPLVDAASQEYVVIIGKGIDTQSLSVTELKDYIDGKTANHLMITARKQNDEYVVDRTYQQVYDAIESQITPILRVAGINGYSYYNLNQYDDNAIVFGAPLKTKTVNSEERAYIPTFTLTKTSFFETTKELTSTACGVDIKYTEVTLEEL